MCRSEGKTQSQGGTRIDLSLRGELPVLSQRTRRAAAVGSFPSFPYRLKLRTQSICGCLTCRRPSHLQHRTERQSSSKSGRTAWLANIGRLLDRQVKLRPTRIGSGRVPLCNSCRARVGSVADSRKGSFTLSRVDNSRNQGTTSGTTDRSTLRDSPMWQYGELMMPEKKKAHSGANLYR